MLPEAAASGRGRIAGSAGDGVAVERIFSVHLLALPATVLPDIRQDTMHRALPGEGVVDLAAILRVLHRIGALTWVGPEVFSPDLLALPTAEVAQLADARTRDVVAMAVAAEAE